MRLSRKEVQANEATRQAAMAESDRQADQAADSAAAGGPDGMAAATVLMLASIRSALVAMSAQMGNLSGQLTEIRDGLGERL